MKVKELKELLSNKLDEDEIKFYIWDYEYREEEPYEIGLGKFVELDSSNYFNIGVNKN